MEAYVEDLRARGLWPGTIAKRLTGLSKFYEHCQQKGIDPECEAGFNPVTRARRPKVEPYEGANYLSRKEEAALLDALGTAAVRLAKVLKVRHGLREAEAEEAAWQAEIEEIRRRLEEAEERGSGAALTGDGETR